MAKAASKGGHPLAAFRTFATDLPKFFKTAKDRQVIWRTD